MSGVTGLLHNRIMTPNIQEYLSLTYSFCWCLESFMLSINLTSYEMYWSSVLGEQLVHETIRQIMAARAIHNVFKMTESRMVVSSECMR